MENLNRQHIKKVAYKNHLTFFKFQRSLFYFNLCSKYQIIELKANIN